jgi:hypothetical protein
VSSAVWAVGAIVGPSRFCETVHVVDDRYREALELLGDAWSLGSFIRFRSTASYVANVEPRPLDLRDWLAGRAQWERAGCR